MSTCQFDLKNNGTTSYFSTKAVVCLLQGGAHAWYAAVRKQGTASTIPNLV